MSSPRLVPLAVVFAAIVAATVFVLGWQVSPDVSEYARGHPRPWWSSPLLSAAGSIGGLRLVQAVSVASAIAVAVLVLRYGRWSGLQGIAAALLVVVCGEYLLYAGADAAGAAGALIAARRSRPVRSIALVCSLHVVAGLDLFAWKVASRLPGRPVVLGGLVGPCVAVLLMWHWQGRYFLPWAVLVAASRAPVLDPSHSPRPLLREHSRPGEETSREGVPPPEGPRSGTRAAGVGDPLTSPRKAEGCDVGGGGAPLAAAVSDA